MTDSYKGFLVTLDKEIRKDDAEALITALKMVKGVQDVSPYVKGCEDYMTEQKAWLDAYKEIIEAVVKKRSEKMGWK